MTARQAAISRVATGIVPPADYRGTTATAMMSDVQPTTTESTDTAAPPPTAPPPPHLMPANAAAEEGMETSANAEGTDETVGAFRVTAILVSASALRPGLRPHNETRALTKTFCAQEYRFIMFTDESGEAMLKLSLLRS